MALGILEPQVEHVPGTVYVYDAEQRRAELLETAQHLKKDKSGRAILVPQPSNDPNDPLVSTESTMAFGVLGTVQLILCPRIGLFGSAI